MQGQEKNSDSKRQFRLFSYLCRRSCILELNLRFKKKLNLFGISLGLHYLCTAVGGVPACFGVPAVR